MNDNIKKAFAYLDPEHSTVRAALAEVEQQAARIAELEAQLANAGENITDLEAKIAAPRGTDAQILHERKLTCEAINGAIAFGYQDTNPPPSTDHWLAAFWKIGRKQAELEAAPVAVNDAESVALRDEWIELYALRHIAPHADKFKSTFGLDVPYQQTEQFRRVKAYTHAVIAHMVPDSAMVKDAERLNFVVDKQGIVVSRADSGGIRRYQLFRICEYGTGFVMSGKDRWFDTPREAIDAAIAASAEKGDKA